ncbi:hypothetical protein PR048_032376 [Dryococelus australis]|uniref:Uncharacterized protein n=1 Tax=Dryococelus australis TaxID=614101 RepID=A0ABQ9G586_9NEOP|nr:hypothetical protein PR048_032376 [Dryococelus australis]
MSLFGMLVGPVEEISVLARFQWLPQTPQCSLSSEYLIAPSTLRSIVRDCCDQIWKRFQPIYMPDKKTEQDWINIADEFYKSTNFPNEIGAA